MYRKPERYPYTTYHNGANLHDLEKWALEEMGVLKEWCASLTRLLTLAEENRHNEINDLLTEIEKIINALGIFARNVADYVEKNGAYVDANTQAVKNIYALLVALEEWIEHLATEIFPILQCIENKLYEWDDKISNKFVYIDDQITNLWAAVKNLITQQTSSSVLTFNSDYGFTFYNGFYRDTSPTNTSYLTRAQTKLQTDAGVFVTNEINWTFGGYHPMRNDYVYTTGGDDGVCPLFSHGSENSQSNVVLLTLYDSHFSKMDTYQQNGGGNIFNITPRSARATWEVGLGIHTESGTPYNGVRLNLRTIADGFNQQYYYYIAQGLASTLSFGSCSVDVTFTYSYMQS